MKKLTLFVLIIAGMAACTQKENTTYSQYEKVRNDYHNKVENQSMMAYDIKGDVHFREDTLIYSLHYLYDPHLNKAEWIKQGEVVNTFIKEIVPFAGINTVVIKFWKEGQHLYTATYDAYYYENRMDNVTYILNDIKQVR